MREEHVSSTGLQLRCENQQIILTMVHSISQLWHTVRPAHQPMSHVVRYIACQICAILPCCQVSRVSACCDVQKGSLDGALRGIAPPGHGPPRLHWHLRIRLAAACAHALSYLHSQSPQVGLFTYVWLFIISATWRLHLRCKFDQQSRLSKLQA